MVSSIELVHASLGVLNLAAASASLFILYRRKYFAKVPLGVCLTLLGVNQLGYSIFCHIFLIAPSRSSQNIVWSSPGASNFYGFVKTFFENSIFLSTLLLCVERYLCMFHSRRYKAPLFFTLSLGLWLYAAIWAFFPVFGWGRYNRKGFSADISVFQNEEGGGSGDVSFFVSFVFSNFVVPSAIMLHVIGRLGSSRSSTVWKVNRDERRLASATSIKRVTAYLSIVAFTLTFVKILLILTDLLPSTSLGTAIGLYFEIFHPIVSCGLLFVGPVWYLVGVRRLRQALLSRRSPYSPSVRFSKGTKDEPTDVTRIKMASESPLISRASKVQ